MPGHTSKARAITYRYEGDFDESAVERILRSARERGVVTEFDTGRGRVVWFSGMPGPALRSVRAAVLGVPGVHGHSLVEVLPSPDRFGSVDNKNG